MKKTELKKLIKEAFLTEKKSNLLNENSPGFDNRKQGGALPTLESVKAAYQAKKLKEASAEEEIESTKELTAAVKDLDDAKKEAGLNEDEFAPYDSLIGPVVAGMVEIRKYVENVAPEHLSTFEAADEAIKAFDYAMAYGDGDDLGVPGDNALGLEEADDYDPGALAKVGESTTNGIVVKNTKLANGQVEVEYESGDVQVLEKENGVWVEVDFHKASLEEAKMEKELKHISTEDKKSKELNKIANKLFPKIAKKQEGGKLVNFKPLSKAQRDEVYAEYAKISESVIAEADMIVESFKK